MSGHAALAIIFDNGKFLTLGSWPDNITAVRQAGLPNGNGSDVRVDLPQDAPASFPFVHCVEISDEQYDQLLQQVEGEGHQWARTNNCAGFAGPTFNEFTGSSLDHDDWFGIDTPCELGESIVDANGGVNSNWPVNVPGGPLPNGGDGTSYNLWPLVGGGTTGGVSGGISAGAGTSGRVGPPALSWVGY